MTAENPDGRDTDDQGFSFKDNRRIDPETGQARPAGQADGGADTPQSEQQPEGQPDAEQPAADASDLGVEIPDDASGIEDAEPQPESDEAKRYLDDLQRLNAEYAAYRRRSERDQQAARTAGLQDAVEALMPVLDEVKLAREAGDVTGPYEKHVDRLLEALGKLEVVQYGEAGEIFDPNIHDALMQQPSADVEEPTVFMVMQPGYKIGDRVIRAARVGVHLPEA
ncbi:nucleotide exchange factor GrpE [Brevibacterium sp. HMSC07C04]|uniref:nucleotide exchange factor GrpE n=1 Tax=Brevibacterium sp. HMSC07C04 TaxID=1581130 RepID=UPI0008A2B4CA|nr:nucleotide exchange factor GrpE [Brevibacterium sp. HMSC07C04]OFS27431.1 nucleotide exchange factor GrpE [Brevibacterium sp. HMSC07C04]